MQVRVEWRDKDGKLLVSQIRQIELGAPIFGFNIAELEESPADVTAYIVDAETPVTGSEDDEACGQAAVRDHQRLVQYLLDEWGTEIVDESAGEMAIRLLRKYKLLRAQMGDPVLPQYAPVKL